MMPETCRECPHVFCGMLMKKCRNSEHHSPQVFAIPGPKCVYRKIEEIEARIEVLAKFIEIVCVPDASQ